MQLEDQSPEHRCDPILKCRGLPTTQAGGKFPDDGAGHMVPLPRIVDRRALVSAGSRPSAVGACVRDDADLGCAALES
jgi:hypothetical protein